MEIDMKIKPFGSALAAKAVFLVASALCASQAFAWTADTGWGRMNLNYLNYDCWGGTCRIAGNIQDAKTGDGCVYILTSPASNSIGPTRTCTGQILNFDFNLGTKVNVVYLVREGGSTGGAASVVVWHR
jgi:hypothetical protein